LRSRPAAVSSRFARHSRRRRFLEATQTVVLLVLIVVLYLLPTLIAFGREQSLRRINSP